MDHEMLAVVAKKFRDSDAALNPAAAFIKTLASNIENIFKKISGSNKLKVEAVLYTECRMVIEGQPLPLFTLFGSHNKAADISNAIQGMMRQIFPQGQVEVETISVQRPDGQIEQIEPEEKTIPDEFKFLQKSPGAVILPAPPGVVHLPQGMQMQPQMKRIHNVEASIAICMDDRSFSVVRIHDIRKLDVPVLKEIEDALLKRLASDENFIDEFVLEFKQHYGLGHKIPEEVEVMRREAKRRKRELDREDESESWRGSEE